MTIIFRRPEISLLFLSVLVFLHTIFTNLDHGLWADEVTTVKFADLNWGIMDSFRWWVSFDNHPYLYYLILRFWFFLTGMGDYSIKLLNPLLFTVSVLLSYRIWPKNRIRGFLYFLSLNLTSVWAIFYLVEVRVYGLMLALSLFAASCIYAIAHNRNAGGGSETELYRTFRYLVASAVLLIGIESWGALLGGGTMFLILWKYPELRAYVVKNWPTYTILTIIVMGLMVQYLHIILMYEGLKTLDGFSLELSSLALLTRMTTDFWNHIFVTFRSDVIATVAIVGFLGSLIMARRLPGRELIIFIGPVIFTYGIVLLLNSVLDQAFYRHYSSLLLSPFIFLFVVVAIDHRSIRRWISASIISLFVLANVASIPILEKFPDKPGSMEDVRTYNPTGR